MAIQIIYQGIILKNREAQMKMMLHLFAMLVQHQSQKKLGLLNSVEKEARLGINDVSCDQEN